MTTWAELNKSAGGATTQSSGSWDTLNASAKKATSTQPDQQAVQAQQESDYANSSKGLLVNTLKAPFQEVGQMFQSGIQQANAGSAQAQNSNLSQKAQGLLNFGGGLATAISSPLAPILNRVSSAIDVVSNKVTDSPVVQKAASALPDLPYDKLAQVAGNVGNIAGLLSGGLEAVEAKPLLPESVPVESTSVERNVPIQKIPTTPALSTAIQKDYPEIQSAKAYDIAEQANNLARKGSKASDVQQFIDNEVKKIPKASLPLENSQKGGTIQPEYEPYTPPEQLPVIDMGSKAKSDLPTIQIGAKSPKVKGDVTIEPIKPEIETPILAQQTKSSPRVSAELNNVTKPITTKPVLEKTIKTEPVETPTTVSGVAKSIEAKAIEANLTKGYPEKSGFGSSTFEAEAKKVADLVNSGIDNARAVVRGEKPSDIKAGALIAGMEEYAKKNPSEAGVIMQELANSHLGSTISEGASETSFARMREQDSATARLEELKKSKLEAVGEKKVSRARSIAKSEGKKVNLSKDDLSWNKFLDSIQC